MTTVIIAAFQLGFVYSLLPGPVTIACSQRTLTGGWRQGAWFILGVTLSDLFCIAVIFWGLADVMTNNSLLSLLFWLLSGGWLVKLGVDALRAPVGALKVQSVASQPRTVRRTLMDGVVINLLNPLTLVGWIALGTNFLAVGASDETLPANAALTVLLSMLAGVVVWELLVVGMVSVLRQQMNGRFLKSLSFVGGICLIIYGLGAWISAAQFIAVSQQHLSVVAANFP